MIRNMSDLQAEEKLLSWLLWHGDDLPGILSEVSLIPEVFTKHSFRTIFALMLDLAREGKDVDLESLAIRINEKNMDKDLTLELAQMSEIHLISLRRTSQAIDYAKHVWARWEQRTLVEQMTDKAVELSQCNGDYAERRAEVVEELTSRFKLSYHQQDNLQYLDKKTRDVVVDMIQKMGLEESELEGVHPKLRDVFELTSTFKGGQMITIAGRPSMGKSAAALYFAYQAIRNNTGATVFFSAEMPVEDVIRRLLALETGINLGDLINSNFDERDLDQIERAAELFFSLTDDRRFFIDDTPPKELSFASIEATLKKAQIQCEHINLIAVDYLQLISGFGNGNAHQEVSKWSKYFKGLAKKYHCPLLLVSQLSRSVENRQDKRPLLSDLRESGAIEEDSDMVMLLYREDYYQDIKEDNSVLEINVAKNRHGRTGTAKVLYQKPQQNFKDLSYYSSDYRQM